MAGIEEWVPVIVAVLALVKVLLDHFAKAKLSRVAEVLIREIEQLPAHLDDVDVLGKDRTTENVKKNIEAKSLAMGVAPILSKMVKAYTE